MTDNPFISKSPELLTSYNKKRLVVVNRHPTPASEVCSSCWYQTKCILRTLRGDKPQTCCVYSLFAKGQKKSYTLEETVNYTCRQKCVERQKWEGDPVPHTENYCENNCPVSRFILDKDPSKEEDIEFNEGY